MRDNGAAEQGGNQVPQFKSETVVFPDCFLDMTSMAGGSPVTIPRAR